MAKISLRAYTHEIEVLIERGQTEEAIAHCKYILKQLPKHIDTYRLLGKTYLESQRYSEATDILQRVLSSIPDDFVSQLGMSIIREDEGNLDAAIWHMERAFEVQPSNTAIQDELRRLYGRRDGVEPPKVRLTRGALVRMYARGELFSQAIGEARAAIAEDPQRIDLEIILARMYFLYGQKVEATEVCSRLVSKLPYCFEANRILAEILPSTSRADDAKHFQQNMNGLDPYSAFLSPAAPTSDLVPENAVQIERLDWTPSAEGEQPPEWTRTAGIEYKQETSDLPDWLNSLSPNSLTVSAESQSAPPFEESLDFSTNIPKAEQAEIPEWMREAGWNESSNESKEEPASVFDLAGEDGDDIAEAELPAWLKDLAPPEESDEITPEEQARLDLLDSLLPPEKPLTEPIEELSQTEIHAALDSSESLQSGDLEETISAEAEQTRDVPGWLSDIEIVQDTTIFRTGLTGELPKWLEEELAAGSTESEVISDEELPEWLPSETKDEESTPSDSSLTESDTSATAESDDAEIIAGIAWLESLAENQGADEDTLITSPVDRLDTPPDWVIRETADEQAEVLLPGPFESVPEAAAAFEPPTTKDIEGTDVFEAEAAIEDEPSMSEPVAVVDDTLLDAEMVLSADAGVEEEILVSPAYGAISEFDEPEAALESEETLIFDTDAIEDTGVVGIEVADDETNADQDLTAALETEPAEGTPQTTDQGDVDELDAAFAWLESLAEKQGANEETLSVRPEDRIDSPPDWVLEQMETEGMTQGIAPEHETIEPEDTEQVEVFTSEAELETTDAFSYDQQESEIVPAKSQPAEVSLTETDDEDAFAWLESLAARQGAEEETLLTSPEDRVAAPPEWVYEQTGEPAEMGETETDDEKADTPVFADVPNWMQEITNADENILAETEAGAESEPSDWFAELPAETPPIAPDLETIQELQASPQAASQEEIQALPDWFIEREPEDDRTTEKEDDKASELQPEEPSSIAAPAAPEEDIQIEDKQAAEEDITRPVNIWGVSAEPVETADDVEVMDELTSETLVAAPEEALPKVQIERDEDEIEVPDSLEPELDTTTDVVVEQLMSDDLPQTLLEQAHTLLDSGQIEAAIEQYNQIVESGEMLDLIIEDLRKALDRHPVDISIWQALGDAYLRNDQVQEALDSYTKAEELLR
jgi:tetratricopeptide (TPR) repeat protein